MSSKKANSISFIGTSDPSEEVSIENVIAPKSKKLGRGRPAKKARQDHIQVDDTMTDEEVKDTKETETEHEEEEIQMKNLNKEKRSAQERAGVKFPISRLAKFAKDRKYADRVG